jgi:predicted nucleotidyltransferase component of viral defense system
MLRRSDFEKIQRETGFNLDLLEKVYHLTRILNEIQGIDVLRDNLTLKGGTALNFLYLDISRLSIDIDFNFTGKIAKEDMKGIRPGIEEAVMTFGDNLGYDVEERGSSYILSRHRLRYTTIRGTKDHVKIEINYLDRLPIGNTVKRDFNSIFPDITLFPVVTYTLEEITAQKTKACIERTEPRDIFDL